jgi:hypothetical protein
MLLAALVLSPGNKAVTVIDDRQRLVVEDRNELLRVFLVDVKEGDVSHCNDKIAGPIALQEWVDSCVFSVDIDINEKRWLCLEETMREQGKAGIAGMSGGVVRWQG